MHIELLQDSQDVQDQDEHDIEVVNELLVSFDPVQAEEKDDDGNIVIDFTFYIVHIV